MSAERTPPVFCVVKLGGAAITDKSKLETLDASTLRATAAHLAQVATALEAAGSGALVVVHGAGSFGHQQAAAVGVHRGGINHSAAVREGFAQTRASVTRLNHLVVQALLQEGLPAIGLSPCGSWTTSNRQVLADGCATVQAALQAGLVPVLHGDAVFDLELGCTILGGDPIVARLCEVLRPQGAVFLTNVPGIFSRPPGETGAELLARIEVQPGGGWEGRCAGSGRRLSREEVGTSVGGHDTTGGIDGKVKEAAGIALGLGIQVRIAQAGTPSGLAACRPGPLPPDWEGTVVLPAGPQAGGGA